MGRAMRFWDQTGPLLQVFSRGVIFRILPLLVMGFITAFALYHSISLFQYQDYYTWTILLVLVGLGMAGIFSPGLRGLLARVDVRWGLPLIIVIGALIRIWFINSLPTQPIFDFATYHQAAIDVSHANWEGLKALEGKPWGYPLLLGLFYKGLGTEVAVAQYLNVVFTGLSVWLLFLIVRTLMGNAYGLLAAIIYTLFPSQIFMNNVINSELLFIVLALAGLYYSIRFMQDFAWLNLVLAGGFMGLSHVVRPLGMFYLLALLAFLLLQLGPRHIKSILKFTAVAVVSFYLMSVPFLALKSGIYKQVILWEKGTFGIVFLMGTNAQHQGYWNQEDYDYIKSLEARYQNNAEKVNAEAFKTAIWRLRVNQDFKLMVPAKIYNMWAIDTFGFEWANTGTGGAMIIQDEELLKNYRGVSQIYYAIILFGIMVALVFLRMENEPAVRYLMLIFLGFVLLHVFIEVQGRYHMHITPIMLIFLCYGFYLRDGIMQRAAQIFDSTHG